MLTPDSSRFWLRDAWQPGRTPPSFDNQPVRDELAASGWDKRPPPPALSEATIAANRAGLRALAVATLDGNWEHDHTVPSRTLYPHQWSWDSAFSALGWSHVRPARAWRELASLFRAQWVDGRVPHIVFNPALRVRSYFPGPEFWASACAAGAPAAATSGLVQPPVHALAAWLTYRRDPSDAAYRAMNEIRADVQSSMAEPVPMHLRNAPTGFMKRWGYGEGYQHAHEAAEALTAMECLPAALSGKSWYHPTQRGVEKRIAERLEEWLKRRNK